MAQSEDSTAWNPAFRSEDADSVPPPIAMDPPASSTHSSEIPPNAQDPSSATHEVESPSIPDQPESDEQTPDAIAGDSGFSPDVQPEGTAQDAQREDQGPPAESEEHKAPEAVEEPVPAQVDENATVVEEAPPQQPAEPSASVIDTHVANASEPTFNPQHPAEPETPVLANGDTLNSRDFWGSPGNNSDGDFFDQLKTQTKPIYMPGESESRFEEGVPLLDDSPGKSVASPKKDESKIDKIFEEDDDGDGFFNQVQEPAPEPEPQQEPQQEPEVPEQDAVQSSHVHRKSTPQVLESLDTAAPKSPTSDLSPEAQEFDSILAAASNNQVKKTSSEEDLAARWQAELEDDAGEEAPEEDLAARWQAALDDDDELLLEEETGDPSQAQGPETQTGDMTAHGAAPPALSSPFGTPETFGRSKAQTNYAPHQPSTGSLLQGIAPPPANYFAPPPRPNPAPTNRTTSFAAESKEGYKSPYDLPEDLTRPRRPAAKPVAIPGAHMPPPPTRSTTLPVPGPPPKVSSMPSPPTKPTPGPSAAPSRDQNFYEELPLPPPRARSRPASSGRYTPSATVTAPPPPPPSLPSQPPMPPPNPYANISAAPQATPPMGIPPPQPQIQPPEKLDPYPNSFPQDTLSAPTVPSTASRYSPKPPTLQPGNKPPPSPRYSPAPPASTAPPPPLNRYATAPTHFPAHGTTLPFQPRTSSPLAYHEKVSYQPQETSESHPLPHPPVAPSVNSFQQQPTDEVTAPIPPANHVDPHAMNTDIPQGTPPSYQPTHQPSSPPRSRYAPQAYVDEFSKRLAPMGSPPPPAGPPPNDSQFVPLRRSQTQSPGQQITAPKLSAPPLDYQPRPASAHGSSPTKTTNTVSPYAPSQVSVHNRNASQALEFIPPNDGQELDPLERWKGAPIVKFGFGGTITSCFPQHIPRYTAGQPAPKIMSSPGEVKIRQLSDWIPTTDGIVQHPGPLKTKSKKKELLPWLSSKIAAFENEGIPEAARQNPDAFKRHDEKVLLWKVIRLLVEHDGNLESSPEVQKTLRGIIFPHLQGVDNDQPLGGGMFGAAQSLDAPSQPDSVGAHFVEGLRNSLLLGEREKAVWDAVDNRLWGHAMIIASTLDRSVWKQVVQEFVRREVRSPTGSTESLAALYEIFAGNIEESVDELVPPSARAGHQMISRVDGQGSAKNALDGLDSWKDTLGLVLSNRSPEDHAALLALGRLLSSYGRTEAAHVCFIFSRAPVFGGADDPQAGIVLLGADHQHLPSNALNDDDAILLTEAYEFATSVLAGVPTAELPHLLAFKLAHAWSLVDRGFKSEARQYCDAIAAAVKATTRPSGYHHQHLFFGVEELSHRLRQTASDGGSSWISRPSMEKVSGSVWAKFNSFVAGDDSDAASTGSGKAGEQDQGPFANFTGTPTISRSPSVADLYGYPPPGPQPMPSSGSSRYQPNNPYAPSYAASSSPEQFRGRSSMESMRQNSYGFGGALRRGSQDPSTPVESNFGSGTPFYNSPPGVGYQSTPPQPSYMPLAPVDEGSAAQSYPGVSTATMQGSHGTLSYQPPGADTLSQPLDQLPATSAPAVSYMPPVGGGGFEPLGGGGSYEPPSVGFDAPVPEITEEAVDEPRPEPTKKKSFMDDDEDDDEIAARSAAVQKAEKERKDREADEAFRKAAEADAQKPAPQKKSWLSSWLGGGKKESDNNSGGPIRAKLGEEISFYYDKELKKWVNKKDPDSASATRGTPPPPKGMAPPSRTVSNSSMPPPSAASAASGTSPMLMPSRPPSSTGGQSLSSSPAMSSSLAPPQPPMLGGGVPRSVSTGAAMPTPPGSSSGPPPRPTTSLSHASSIDDLLGAPAARKGGAPRGKKKGRYVDVMAK